MRGLYVTALSALCGFATASDVVTLADADFKGKGIGTSADKWFVKFYAPWCGHCKSMAPVWEELGTKFRADKAVHIADVDATVHKIQSDLLGVQGFPTIKLITDAKVYDYGGKRDLPSLSAYVEGGFKDSTNIAVPAWGAAEPPPAAREGPSDIIAVTDDDFDQVCGKEDTCFVELYAPWCGHCKTFLPTYEAWASEMKASGSTIKVTNSDATVHVDLSKRFGLRSFPSLYLVKAGKVYKYEGSERTGEALSAFVNGGFSAVEADKVFNLPAPTPPPHPVFVAIKKSLDAIDKNILIDLEHLYSFRKNALAVVLIAGIFLGMMIQMVLGACCCGKKVAAAPAAKKDSKKSQ